jgi:hypothetical protein
VILSGENGKQVSFDDLIAAAVAETVTAADVERLVTDGTALPTEILDTISRRIAVGYTNGEFDFQVCDAIMNQVFAYSTITPGVELSRFASGVFEAFDQGEFRGEEVTRRLIAAVLRRGFLVSGD